MGIEIPDMDELLAHAPAVRYGDGDAAGDGPDADPDSGARRGGALHLSCVLPALTASIGHPVATAIHRDPERLRRALGLPQASSAVVVLVDGLGYWNLAMRLGHAPYLRSLMNDEANRRPISTCLPSTTVAAMGTFGTGTCPGLTGMTGYTQLNPSNGRICQLIQFTDAMAPDELQRQPTVFESLAAGQVRVTSIGLPKFKNSPLTQAALRGGGYRGSANPRHRILAAGEASATPGLTYLYIRDADKVGHNYGWQSDKWIGTFERIDAQLALLRKSVAHGTAIVITADHGMIMADPAQRIDIAAEPELMKGVALVGGEPRSVMLYAEPSCDPEEVAHRWRSRLDGLARVRTKREAMEQGLFGDVDPRVVPMIGDVIVQALRSVTIVDSRTQSDKAMSLPSVHGSASRMETDIPCLVDLA